MRDVLETVPWGGDKKITLRSENGNDFLGDIGAPGFILLVRRDCTGMFTARVENRAAKNSWASRHPKTSIGAAVANVRRELLNLGRIARGLG